MHGRGRLLALSGEVMLAIEMHQEMNKLTKLSPFSFVIFVGSPLGKACSKIGTSPALAASYILVAKAIASGGKLPGVLSIFDPSLAFDPFEPFEPADPLEPFDPLEPLDPFESPELLESWEPGKEFEDDILNVDEWCFLVGGGGWWGYILVGGDDVRLMTVTSELGY